MINGSISTTWKTAEELEVDKAQEGHETEYCKAVSEQDGFVMQQ